MHYTLLGIILLNFDREVVIANQMETILTNDIQILVYLIP